jgi:hypothetical protein
VHDETITTPAGQTDTRVPRSQAIEIGASTLAAAAMFAMEPGLLRD